MEIKKLLVYTEKFEDFISKIETGREQLEELTVFVQDPEMDENSRIYFKTMIGQALPSLAAAFIALETVLTQSQEPPTE